MVSKTFKFKRIPSMESDENIRFVLWLRKWESKVLETPLKRKPIVEVKLKKVM